ncbi:MAG: hypothetical protein ACRDWA_05030 [Acidimicrobiia bacterium]
MSRSSSSDLTLGVAYWVIVVSLLVLGFLSMFTIGLGFLLVAAAMIVLSPFRSKPRVWWSGMALVVGSLIGYAAVGPWGCSQVATFDVVTGVAEEAPTVCRSLIGIEYTGPDGFQPSRTPGVIAGVVLGGLAAWAVWIRIGAQQRRAESDFMPPRSTDPPR